MQPLILKAVLLLFCTLSLSAYSQHQIKTFTKKEGLTSVSVTATLVDSKGIVWVGTDVGLNAYANATWYPIKYIEDNKTGKMIPLNKIELIYEDRKRNIWISAAGGLFLYNGEYWTNFKQKTSEESYVVKQFVEDRQGRIWCAEEYHKDLSEIKEFGFNLISGKLQMYDYIRWYNFDDDLASTATCDYKTTPVYFTSIFQDRLGSMWFSTLDGIYQFDQKKWIKYEKDALNADKVFRLLDNKGEKWAATESGISRLEGDTWINYNKKDGIGGSFIYDMKQDPKGRIWAFARSELKFVGLSMFDGNQWYSFDNDDLKIKGFVEELLWDGDDIIAFSDNGVSVFRDNNWHRFGKKEGLKNESKYFQILKTRKGEILLACGAGFYRYADKKWEKLYSPDHGWEVTIIFSDSDNQLWLGTTKSGMYHFNGDEWFHYDETNGLADDQVNDIFRDKKGNTWVISKKGISLFAEVPAQ